MSDKKVTNDNINTQ